MKSSVIERNEKTLEMRKRLVFYESKCFDLYCSKYSMNNIFQGKLGKHEKKTKDPKFSF